MSTASGRRRVPTQRSGGGQRTRTTRAGSRSNRTVRNAVNRPQEEDGDDLVVLDETFGSPIDLTSEDPHDVSIIDLTNQETPVSLRPITLSQGVHRVFNDDSDVEEIDNELPDLPAFDCAGTPFRPPVTFTEVGEIEELPDLSVDSAAPIGRQEAGDGAAGPSTSITSPAAVFTCPICLDTDKQIRKSGRKMFSTNCGHLFCDECLKGAVRAQSRCPTCRKRQTSSTIHPIFYG